MPKKGLLPAFAVLMLAGFVFSASARAAVDFQKYDEALSRAAAENKHVMLYFWADWCQYCAMFNKEVLPDEKVMESLNSSFLSVQVDIEEEPALAEKYEARTLPMIVFLDSAGKVAGYLPGYLPPVEFLEILSFVKNKKYLK